MANDIQERGEPLDREVSFSVRLTESGIEGRAKSRAVTAVDRLIGNTVDVPNVWIERWLAPARARSEAETQIIAAALDAVLSRMGTDPTFAQQAIDSHLGKILRKHKNVSEVVRLSVENLRDNPPSECEAALGPERLDENFLGRIETYAERASTEELRVRWARVLASEVRKPGTFSPSVLRIVDEIDADVAQFFNILAENRIGKIVPWCFVSPALREVLPDLSAAGLVEATSIMASESFFEIVDTAGVSVSILMAGDAAFGTTIDYLSYAGTEASNKAGFVVSAVDQEITSGLAAYLYVCRLTRAGLAIASLSGEVERQNLARLAILFRDGLDAETVQTYRIDPETDEFIPADLTDEVRMLDKWPPTAPIKRKP